MKKLYAVILAAVIVLASCSTVFAAGINSAEQSVLNNMRTPANMNGHSVYVPSSYINQAEAHFNTIEMTQAQADKINGLISAGRSFIEKTGKSSVGDMSVSQKQKLLSYAAQAAAVLNLTTVAGSDETRVKITTKDGNIVVDESENIIKPTGPSSVFLPVAIVSFIFAGLIAASAYLIILKKRELINEEY